MTTTTAATCLSAPPRRGDRALAQLGPIAQLRAGRLGLRLPQLAVGLFAYGFTMAMMIRSSLGNTPWDVLHQGVAKNTGMSLGTVVIIFSVIVLLFWIPLKEMPGMGTIANSIVVGLAANVGLAVLPHPHDLAPRIALLLGGIIGNAVATAMYIGSQFGAGPRDGLMTALNRRTGVSIRVVRTGLEALVVVLGWLLGGVAGIGTLLYALAIGPLTQLLLPYFIVELKTEVSDESR